MSFDEFDDGEPEENILDDEDSNYPDYDGVYPDGYFDPFGGGDPDEDLIDGVGFADPGGESALRAATPNNPRNLPCPTCKKPNRLTPLDAAHHYQCDSCARRSEGWGG